MEVLFLCLKISAKDGVSGNSGGKFSGAGMTLHCGSLRIKRLLNTFPLDATQHIIHRFTSQQIYIRVCNLGEIGIKWFIVVLIAISTFVQCADLYSWPLNSPWNRW